MTPADFKARALAHLDQCDEAEMERWATDQPGAGMFADLYTRWGHARAAFPGMSWEEFCNIDRSRSRKGKQGRPRGSRDDKLSRAALDADRIKAFWKAARTDNSRPPVHPHDLAAERHGFDLQQRQALEDLIRRPRSRRPESTARK